MRKKNSSDVVIPYDVIFGPEFDAFVRLPTTQQVVLRMRKKLPHYANSNKKLPVQADGKKYSPSENFFPYAPLITAKESVTVQIQRRTDKNLLITSSVSSSVK